MGYVSWPNKVIASNTGGNKASKLSQLTLDGYAIPKFFCLTFDAFHDFLNMQNVEESIRRLLAEIDYSDFRSVQKYSKLIGDLISAQPLPRKISTDLKEALNTLCSPYVAVRSSSLFEDLSDKSFAGLYSSFLNISQTHVVQYVKKCWIDGYSFHNIYIRHQLGIEYFDQLAIIVQEMIVPVASGVVFTRSISSDDSSRMLINATLGIGVGLVDGKVPSDTYLVHRVTLEPNISQVSEKDYYLSVRKNRDGLKAVKVSTTRRKRSVLNRKQLLALSKLCLDVESSYNDVPQDVEWCYSKRKFYILQSRPITSKTPSMNDDEIRSKILADIKGQDAVATWWLSDNLGRIPLSPLAQHIWQVSADARENASEQLKLPRLITWGIFYDYIYVGSRPVQGSENVERRNQLRNVRCREFADKWELEFRDEVQTNNALLQGLTTSQDSFWQTLDNFDQALKIWHRHWIIHDLVMNAKRFALDNFIDFFSESFSEEDSIKLPVLLQGFDNINEKITAELIKLSFFLSDDPEIVDCLAVRDGNVMNCLVQKNKTEFIKRLQLFLDKFGNRIIGPNDFLHPSWKNSPEFIYKSILSFYGAGKQDIAVIEKEQLIKQRTYFESLLMSKISNKQTRLIFLEKLEEARTWPVFLEDHNFLIEQELVSNIREICLNMGRYLVENATISTADDVFFLKYPELKNIDSLKVDFKYLVEFRKEMYFSKLDAVIPQTISPSGKLDEPAKSPHLGETISQNEKLKINFFPDPTRELPFRLLGLPASPGRVTGPAKIIGDIDEFEKIKPGDILVCQRTTPPWTPLFSLIGGLVTNAGSGILQHSAINAREFGIPAVIGTKVATNTIVSGQIITIDGTKGIVELIPTTSEDAE